MKKLIVFVLLISFSNRSLSQNEKETTQKDSCRTVEMIGYLGFNLNLNDNFKLNNTLKQQGLVEINTVIPELVFGFAGFGKKYSGDFEFGFLFSNEKKNNNEVRQMGFNIRGRFHYNIVNKEKFAFTSGVSIAHSSNNIDIFSRNNTIDLNDLNPENNSGHISLKNQMLYAGPSLSVYLFRKSFPLRLNVAYEFALTRGRYRSDYARVQNTFGENGINRFVIGIVY